MSDPRKPIKREAHREREGPEQHTEIPWDPDAGIVLSPQASVEFLTALLTPKEPNAKLREAVEIYRAFLRDSAIDG